jgi:hypothetical protein
LCYQWFCHCGTMGKTVVWGLTQFAFVRGSFLAIGQTIVPIVLRIVFAGIDEKWWRKAMEG